MTELKQIKAAFDELKTAVAEERLQAREKLDELLAKSDALALNLAQGGTPEERDQLLADIRAEITAIKDIIPDPAPPPPPEG